jgi:hypothetical protein
MLFKETVAVYCENRTEHINTLCGENTEFSYVEAIAAYSNHWALRFNDVSNWGLRSVEEVNKQGYKGTDCEIIYTISMCGRTV